MSIMNNKQSTKDRIIEAAFSFFDTPCFTQFSLNDVAKKAEISKAAIFHHFKNKEALYLAMQDKFIDKIILFLSSVTKELSEEDWKKSNSIYSIIARQSVSSIKDNIQLLYYILFLEANSIDTKKEFRNRVQKKLNEYAQNNNLNILFEVFKNFSGTSYVNGKQIIFDIEKQCASAYTIITSFCFCLLSNINYFQPYNLFTKENQTEDIVSLIDFGLVEPGNKISHKRMEEINELSKYDYSSIPEENPLFKALAQVIKEFGFPGVTVERISEKLGLAKSSLYTYFDSKNDLIRNLIDDEYSFFEKRIAKLHDQFSDKIELSYAFLHEVSEYFIFRPDLLSIFKWTRMKGKLIPGKNPFKDAAKKNSSFNDNGFFKTKTFDIPYPIYFMWLGSLSSSIQVMNEDFSWTKDQYNKAIQNIFDYIQNGITRTNEI